MSHNLHYKMNFTVCLLRMTYISSVITIATANYDHPLLINNKTLTWMIS